MQLSKIAEARVSDDIIDEGFKEKLTAGLVGAGITAGTMFGGGAMMNQAPQQQTQQQQTQGSESLDATKNIQRKILNRNGETYYFYYQSNQSKSTNIKLAHQKAFKIKATNQFIKDTGSNMKGVENGLSTKDGVSGIWFKIK